MQVKALGEYMRKLVDSNVMSFRKSVVIPLLDEMASGPTHTWKHPRSLRASIRVARGSHAHWCLSTDGCLCPSLW